jgi:hypothetical protein
MVGIARREIHKAAAEGQNKYTYFLVAVAGAPSPLASRSRKPPGRSPSLSSWAFSFYADCRLLNDLTSILQQNYDLIDDLR